MGWLKEASSKVHAECWDMNSGEHTHKETKRSEIGPLSSMLWSPRDR